MKTLLCLGSVLVVQALSAQAPAAPKPLWTVTTGLASPESAYSHLGTIFVSNINGGVLDRDGNGYITRIARGGKIIAARWATGLNAPKGLRSIGNTIWVADIDEVVGFEVTRDGGSRPAGRVKVEGAQSPRWRPSIRPAPISATRERWSSSYRRAPSTCRSCSRTRWPPTTCFP